MFFMNKKGEGKGRGGSEKLMILGATRSRRGAELKVMSGVETKSPGYFTKGVREKTSSERGFDTDRLTFKKLKQLCKEKLRDGRGKGSRSPSRGRPGQGQP